jgi:hypothetical protein
MLPPVFTAFFYCLDPDDYHSEIAGKQQAHVADIVVRYTNRATHPLRHVTVLQER